MKRAPDPVAVGAAALRRLTADDATAGDVTRARLLARLERRRPHAWLSKRTAVVVLLPLIASSALAATVAAVLTRDVPAPAAPGAPKAAVSHPRTPSPPAIAITAESSSPVEVPPNLPAPPQPAPPALPETTGTTGTTAKAADDAELTAYGAAHKAHFVGRDFARALRLWNGYLRGFPRGRLVPEATYNRAIALVRLGRTDEAITALRPIAAGRFTGYRQVEAQALLEALRPD